MSNMMMPMGPLVMGFHLETFLMLLSGILYIVCAAFLWKPFREEKNELIGALFAFFIYQAFNMFFMGLEMHTMNMVYSNIAALAVFIGSAYMLKFPLSSLSAKTRRILFMLSLIIVLAIWGWFVQTPDRQMELMHFILWYDILVNGVVIGGSIIILGIRAHENWMRIKALGGGSGVVSCCVVASGAMLSGAMMTSAVAGFAAPVLIMGSLNIARKKQKAATMIPPTATV